MTARFRNSLLCLVAAGLILSAAAPAISCSGSAYKGAPQTITLGDLSVDSSLFIYIAQAQNFFAQNGINLVLKPYATGPLAVQALNDGEIDMASASEYPFAGQVTAGANLQALCCMDLFRAFYLVGRTDLGITSAASLKSKKVGLVQKGLPEFYLGRFLTLNGMNLSDVTTVNVAPADLAASIAGGAVDAVVVNQAYLAAVETQIAGRYTAWEIQNYQEAFGLVFCTGDWLGQNQAAAGRFLKALTQAELYFTGHQAESKALLQQKFNYSADYIASLWPEHRFSLSLSPALVTTMEDETRWMIANKLTSQTAVPDFLDHVYTGGLGALKPDAVNIG